MVNPGDTLVVRLDPATATREKLTEIADGIKARSPGIEVLCIAAPEIAVIRKPE